MDAASRQRRQKRHLSRAALSDPWQQEQGVNSLVELALSEARADPRALAVEGEAVEGLLQPLRPSTETGALPSLSVATAVCQGMSLDWWRCEIDCVRTNQTNPKHQPISFRLPLAGLERLAAEQKGHPDVRALVRKLLGVIESTLTARSEAVSIAAASFASKRGQQQDQEEALLSIYVGALASLSLQAVAQQQQGPGLDGDSSSMVVDDGSGEPAEYLWCEQPPLAMALGLSPAALARPIFAEASFFARTQLPCAPEAAGKALAAVQCPLVVSVLLEARCKSPHRAERGVAHETHLLFLLSCSTTLSPSTVAGLRDALLQALGAAPLDYLPQPALAALGIAFLAVLPFLSTHSSAEAARVLEWSKLAFHIVCHMDDPVDAGRVGRRLVGQLMAVALAFQAQGACLIQPSPSRAGGTKQDICLTGIVSLPAHTTTQPCTPTWCSRSS